MRYSGSPVPLSFSEAGHTKGSWLVDVDRVAGSSVEAVDAPVERPLAVLRGDIDLLLTDPALTAAERAWCQVTLTDPVRPLGAMEQLRRRFPHTLVLQFDPQGAPVPVRSYAQRTVGGVRPRRVLLVPRPRPRRPRTVRGGARRARRRPSRPCGCSAPVPTTRASCR